MNDAPLAYRLRPSLLADVAGHEELLGEGKPLRVQIERDELRSLIFSGPPGTGKTSLAHVVANVTKAQFVSLNAVTSGVKELKEVCEVAARMRKNLTQKTVLFIDEIHRFNTSQQDVLLPYVENGDVILIGATTQNPYFDVNAALISRSRVYLLKPLSEDDIVSILKRAVVDERGFAGKVKVSTEALRKIAQVSNGDARIALNSLELAAMTAGGTIGIKDAEKILAERARRFDKKGEDHYNTASAFIKSMRGSDPDAALLWLFSAIEGGEDPRFLFRRMAIFASEDIGNADPRALQMVVSAWQAFELVGYPEGEFFLAHACVYLAQAPKSNAITRAMGSAKRILAAAPQVEVPNHLRNASVKGMQEQGYGRGYVYPHDIEGGVVADVSYFPVGMQPVNVYEPSDRGFEQDVLQRLTKIRKTLGR